MAKRRSPIPPCRSRFLQDVTIALGRRSLKSLRYSNPTLKFDVTEEELNGAVSERFDIEARTQSGKITKISLWDDGVSWVYSIERGGKRSISAAVEIHANLAEMKAEAVAELLRATLADLVSVEEVWRGRTVSQGGARSDPDGRA